jgi:hypothetical protein
MEAGGTLEALKIHEFGGFIDDDVETFCFSDDDTHAFLRSLSNMPNMRKLLIWIEGHPSYMIRTKEAASLLLQAVRRNTSLVEVEFDGNGYDGICTKLRTIIQSYREKIDFYLKLNGLGRRFLVNPDNAPPPHSAVPLGLARVASEQNPSSLFYFLSELKGAFLVEPSREYPIGVLSDEDSEPSVVARGKKRPREEDFDETCSV